MCGIAGISSTQPVDRTSLEAAITTLRKRGPDSDGIFVSQDECAGLAHTRLSIIDLNPTGAQPMISASGRYVMVYNGEFYNFADLRSELERNGTTFRGTSDSEVLLEGFARLGIEVFARINGIFALAIHDRDTGEVLVARDQMGVKPLYFADLGGAVTFASELKAVLTLATTPQDLDPEALRRYLTFLWQPGNATPFKAVRKLGPGEAMVLKDGRIKRRWVYWRAPAYQPRRDFTAMSATAEIRKTLGECVERQMISDAPLGAFLSGGLDSSAIVAIARRHNPGLECFTIDTGDTEEGTTEDLPYARLVAKHLDVRLHEVRVSSQALCDGVEDMVRILDEPLADPACLNVLFISQLARREGFKVLLSGAGGDDLFTGYRRHAALALDPVWALVPRPLRQAAATLAAGGDRRVAKALAAAAKPGADRILSTFAWGPEGIAGRLIPGPAQDVFAPMRTMLDAVGNIPPIEKCLALERRFFLVDHNLTYTDKMGMAASVEIRVPFLDLAMVELASRIPLRLKQKGLRTKWALRESQRGILPDAIIDRPKTGFGAPLRRWMAGPMAPLMNDILSPAALRTAGIFDPAEVTRLRERLGRGEDVAYVLFSVMCIELWRRTFTGRASNCGKTAA
jgi:asparagine synthase (glutamine-hydrolysing)